jgi:hypothetical protein
MKKVSVIGKFNSWEFTGEEVSSQAWIDESLAGHSWGKPEREIVEYSESYDEADVKSRRSESVGEGVINYVTLRAEYEIKETDLSQDYDWLLQECYRQRLAEYPTLAEISEALMEKFGENRYQKFDELHEKRMAVKAKHKKPVKV